MKQISLLFFLFLLLLLPEASFPQPNSSRCPLDFSVLNKFVAAAQANPSWVPSSLSNRCDYALQYLHLAQAQFLRTNSLFLIPNTSSSTSACLSSLSSLLSPPPPLLPPLRLRPPRPVPLLRLRQPHLPLRLRLPRPPLRPRRRLPRLQRLPRRLPLRLPVHRLHRLPHPTQRLPPRPRPLQPHPLQRLPLHLRRRQPQPRRPRRPLHRRLPLPPPDPPLLLPRRGWRQQHRLGLRARRGLLPPPPPPRRRILLPAPEEEGAAAEAGGGQGHQHPVARARLGGRQHQPRQVPLRGGQGRHQELLPGPHHRPRRVRERLPGGPGGRLGGRAEEVQELLRRRGRQLRARGGGDRERAPREPGRAEGVLHRDHAHGGPPEDHRLRPDEEREPPRPPLLLRGGREGQA
ncbi:putative LRR receptor-like serine/threonine-protein kinase RKF3 [Iris pallida]|uniref:LRR receptor-like serine/threonine-protein kinase RKF3 n=1 Tax=Iris pallida TaxID=29817 RepID=A0AAX6I6A8_IRIPA|nr:putative LRR receptor-like serine/threonine-protein kinase RKF3 [Iris pallida]